MSEMSRATIGDKEDQLNQQLEKKTEMAHNPVVL
jgi:hypothetical protein